jgi:hypothetical protein
MRFGGGRIVVRLTRCLTLHRIGLGSTGPQRTPIQSGSEASGTLTYSVGPLIHDHGDWSIFQPLRGLLQTS